MLKLISTTGIHFHLILLWKASHAAIKDNQNKLDMNFVKSLSLSFNEKFKLDPKEQTMALKTGDIFY